MNCANFFLVVIVPVILSLQTSAVPVHPGNEAEVRQYIDALYRRTRSLLHKIRDFGSEEDFKELTELGMETSQTLKTFKNIPINDPLLKREVEVQSDSGLLILGKKYLSLLEISNDFVAMATDQNICSYKRPYECDLAYVPDVMKVFEESHDANELMYYWKAWRDKNGIRASINLEKVVQAYKEAAKLNENTPTEEWFGFYYDVDFLQKMEDVMQEIKPFYSEFHAYVRSVLNRKYGDLVISSNGLIPHHLLEQILIQAGQENGLLDQPYPEKNEPILSRQWEQIAAAGLSARRIAKVADNFFTSLGFPDLSETFWKDAKEQSAGEDDEECEAVVFDLTSEVALNFCPKPSFKGFLQLHEDFARIHYAVQKANLPLGLSASYDFEYAVGESAILSASTLKHMKRLVLKGHDYDDEVSMNRLFRLGVHTMFQIPQFFVHSKIMVEILEDKVSLNQASKRYWKLMNEYAGIQPPVRWFSHNLDFPYEFYQDIEENPQTKKFVTQILRYQLYRALCKISGEYIAGKHSSPLQNCDYYGSDAAGDALKKMMALGESKPWEQVLAVIIDDEPALNGAALMEFYEPLHDWLWRQNRINNASYGWY